MNVFFKKFNEFPISHIIPLTVVGLFLGIFFLLNSMHRLEHLIMLLRDSRKGFFRKSFHSKYYILIERKFVTSITFSVKR